MPAKRRNLDPSTHDYTVTAGGPVEDTTHTSTVVLLLSLHHGSCAVAPELGNKIWTQLGKLGDGAARKAEQYAVEALRPLTRARLISDVRASAAVSDGGRLGLEVSYTDQNGKPRTLSLPIARGA